MGFIASVMLIHISLLLSLHGPRDSQHLSCWLMNPCRLFLYCLAYGIHSICRAGSWIPAAGLYTALLTRFTASDVLAHESLPPVFILPCLRDSQHLSCWLMNPCRLSLYCLAYVIHSIWRAGSWIPAACLYTALPTRFTASVMLAHESLPPVFILPCLQDSQHLSCRLMNSCRLSLYCPTYEIHSICQAGSWIPAASPIPVLPYPRDLQRTGTVYITNQTMAIIVCSNLLQP
jgi:putative component of membrane protein insertase Oxa1/YidC/SpoIIIJ protein YidD